MLVHVISGWYFFLFYCKHSNQNEQIIIVRVIICHVYYIKMFIKLKYENNHKIKICYQHETLSEFAT